jgi:hypothetical protein
MPGMPDTHLLHVGHLRRDRSLICGDDESSQASDPADGRLMKVRPVHVTLCYLRAGTSDISVTRKGP